MASARPLKIAMVISYDLRHAGGVQIHVHRLTKELEELGHMVDVYGTRNTRFAYSHYI